MYKLPLKNAGLFLFMLFSAVFLNSCSKDDDPVSEEGSYKITITATNVTTDDYISFVASGSPVDFNANTPWKINGAERTGETAVSVTDDDLAGGTKTVVIESARPLRMVAIGAQFIPTAQAISISFKVEKNGQIQVEENLQLAPEQSFSRNYSF